MIFINEEHKLFYEGKMNQIGKYDVYYKSLIYTLSICSETRKYFNEIFDCDPEIKEPTEADYIIVQMVIDGICCPG